MSWHRHRLNRLERLQRLEAQRQDHPARIPDWLRPWLDPLTIEDLELLEAGGFIPGAGGDLAALSPEQRERFQELERSWETFCADHERGA